MGALDALLKALLPLTRGIDAVSTSIGKRLQFRKGGETEGLLVIKNSPHSLSAGVLEGTCAFTVGVQHGH